MASWDFVLRILLSLAVGAVIGLERERSGQPFVGLRSFALVCMLGVFLTLFDPTSTLAIIGLGGVFMLAVAYYYQKSTKGAMGVTTALMLPFTFLLGVAIGLNYLIEAGVAAIAAVYLLVEKKEVHALTQTVTKEEVIDLLLLGIILFIVYPQLPDAPVDAAGFHVNVKYVWTIVALMSGISFAAHVLNKYAGRKGVLYSAFFGGIASSLGTVALFVQKTKKTKALKFVLAVAALGAFLGDVVMLAVINANALVRIIPLLGCIFAGLAAYAYREGKAKAPRIAEGKHALSLRFALEFTALFFAISLLLGWATNLGEVGTGAFALLGGIASSSAVIASSAYLFLNGTIGESAFATSFFLAVFGSMAVKTFFLSVKTGDYKEYTKPLVIVMASGLLGLYLTSVL